MKKFVVLMILLWWLSGVRGWAQSEGRLPDMVADTIGSFPLGLTERYTTNLLFPHPIFNVDLGTGDVLAKRLGRTGNVLLLKANRAHFAGTNVSVYLVDGRLYSFRVGYVDSPGVLNYRFQGGAGATAYPWVQFSGRTVEEPTLIADAQLLGRARGFLSVGGSAEGVRLCLKGIYLKYGLLWFCFQSRNGSSIDFVPGLLRFSIEDRRRARRTAVQSITVEPVYLPALDTLSGGGRGHLVAGFRPFTLTRDKRLVVEWSEEVGGRRVRVVIGAKELLRARNYH